jgi:hypothetical protein
MKIFGTMRGPKGGRTYAGSMTTTAANVKARRIFGKGKCGRHPGQE